MHTTSAESSVANERAESIALVGLMGAGKTTLGKIVARRLELEFVDSDDEIVRITGVEIATIFEIEGEPSFRDREESTIAAILQRPAVLLSTGGGAVMRESTRALLKKKSIVVYLHATPEVVWQRIRHHRGRPLLAGEDPLGRLRSLYATRDHMYREAAHIVLDISHDPPQQVAMRVIEAIEAYT